MRIRRSPATPMVGVKAMPLSTQKTLHDGDTPMPERWKSPSRRSGTYFARVTPAEIGHRTRDELNALGAQFAMRSSVDSGIEPPRTSTSLREVYVMNVSESLRFAL